MTKHKYTYDFGISYPGRLQFGLVEIERETAKTAWLKRTVGGVASYKRRLPKELVFDTAADVLKAVEAEAERRIRRHKKELQDMEDALNDLRKAAAKERE